MHTFRRQLRGRARILGIAVLLVGASAAAWMARSWRTQQQPPVPPSACAVEAPASRSDWAGLRVDTPDIPGSEPTLRLLHAENFSALDARMNGYQRAWEQGEISDMDLQRAFRAFYVADGALQPKLDKWLAAFPRSYAMHLARAIHARERGLLFPVGSAERERWFERALAELAAAESPKPILSEQLRMSIASYRQTRGELDEIAARASIAMPNNFIIRRKYMLVLNNAWGGNHEAMLHYRKSLDAAGLPAAQLQVLDAMILADEGWLLARRDHDLRAAAQRYRQAIDLTRPLQALVENQNYTEMLGDAISIANDLGDDETALRYLAEALVLDPNDGDLHGRRGGTLLRMGRMREGIASLERASALGDAWSQNELAAHYWHGEDVPMDRKKALALYTCAAQQGFPEAVKNLQIAREEHK